MSILGDSVRNTRKLKKWSQSDLATKADVSQTTISDIERGRNDTSKELPKIAKALGVSTDMLVYGEQAYTKIMIPVEPWDSETPLDDDEVAIPFYKDFLLACGSGTTGEAMASERRRLRLSKSTLKGYGVEPDNAVAMTAFGDSMKYVINDKATVYVDLGKTKAIDGKIYAIDHGGVFKFKYLYNLPLGGLRVVSENSEEYPEERLTAQDIIDQEFRILGYAFNVQNGLP